MGKVGLEKYYICLAIPQFCCAIILISLVLTFSSTKWDQEVLDYVTDSWELKAIQNVYVVPQTSSCNSGDSSVSYTWPGTKMLCICTRGTYAGTVQYRACKTIKEKESYQKCKTKDGRTTCSTKYRTVEYPEGTELKGLSTSSESIFWGYKTCYSRGKLNYKSVSNDRKRFAKNSDSTTCYDGKTECGGSSSNSYDTEFTYCSKTAEGYTCPVQSLATEGSYNSKKGIWSFTSTAYRQDMGKEPVIGLKLGLDGRCINGERYIPSRSLDYLFQTTPFECTSREDNWNKTTVLPADQLSAIGQMNEYDFLYYNDVVQKVYDKYISYPSVGYTWQYQQNDAMYLQQITYPHWDYTCDKAGYNANMFATFAGKMGTIDAMAFGIQICQFIILAFTLIFFGATLWVTKCGKKPVTTCLHYGLITKLVVTIFLNIACLALVIVFMATAYGLDADEIDFYRYNYCIEDYVSHQIELFHPFYKGIAVNAIVIFVACFLQNLYEALIYPSIRFKWVGRYVEFDTAKGMHQGSVAADVTVTKTTMVAPTPMMAPQPVMMQQPGMVPQQQMMGQQQMMNQQQMMQQQQMMGQQQMMQPR